MADTNKPKIVSVRAKFWRNSMEFSAEFGRKFFKISPKIEENEPVIYYEDVLTGYEKKISFSGMRYEEFKKLPELERRIIIRVLEEGG